MTDLPGFLDLCKSIGFPAVIFAIWYLYHKSQVKAWQDQLAAQVKREDQIFALLSGQLEAMQSIVGQNARIETKIDSSQYCPLVRRESRAS